MRPLLRQALWLSLAWSSAAFEFLITQDYDKAEMCSGMYSKASWGGSVDPYIDVKFLPQPDSNAIASLIIYEYRDFQLIGQVDPENAERTIHKCDIRSVSLQLCNQTQVGEYLLAPNATVLSKNVISTVAIRLKDPKPQKYKVKNTGYYCVGTEASEQDTKYEAIVEFRNAYGELAAAQIAKLPFYGGMTIVYAVIGIFWGFLYAQNRHDILPVQNYITAIIGFLVVEMLITWGYYDFENVHGATAGTSVFLAIVAILNSARNAFSFFLLLIVCMGYGVVKPTLGKTMTRIRILGVCHFIFCIVYTTASMVLKPEYAGALVLLTILPLSTTLTIFYTWTLSSITATIKDLVARKQHNKALMYNRLWRLILVTILVIFGFFFINSLTFTSVGDDDFAPTHWQTRWFILDGWLNIVYLIDVAVVAYLWRPTANNRRFAMSDEISQDDDGFEIHSLAGSLDDSDSEENPSQIFGGKAQDIESNPRTNNRSNTEQSSFERRYQSPLPAPRPTRPASLSKVSLEGETIFAVGEDEDEDRWSDDEAEDDKLHKKGD